MKIISIVGARPQFIKSAPVSKAINKAGNDEYIIHTGQHYDYEMSKIFFDEMGIREPDINLNIGSGTHAQQTGQMLIGIETILLDQKPDIVLVYGDTNSTLAGALATVKLQIKLGHIEAGLRSYNRQMPEEHNRVLADHCADILFCPTQTAVDNLLREGILSGIHLVGDTMLDAILQFKEIAVERSSIMHDLHLKPKGYCLLTIHRQYNTDNPTVLNQLLATLGKSECTFIFPCHPRTMHVIHDSKITIPPNVSAISPVGYLDMLMLENNAEAILTDSGGVQKEAYFLKVKCLTLRPETEWVETVASGWNVLVSTDSEEILAGLSRASPSELPNLQYFGDGHASEKIVDLFN